LQSPDHSKQEKEAVGNEKVPQLNMSNAMSVEQNYLSNTNKVQNIISLQLSHKSRNSHKRIRDQPCPEDDTWRAETLSQDGSEQCEQIRQAFEPSCNDLQKFVARNEESAGSLSHQRNNFGEHFQSETLQLNNRRL